MKCQMSTEDIKCLTLTKIAFFFNLYFSNGTFYLLIGRIGENWRFKPPSERFIGLSVEYNICHEKKTWVHDTDTPLSFQIYEKPSGV